MKPIYFIIALAALSQACVYKKSICASNPNDARCGADANVDSGALVDTGVVDGAIADAGMDGAPRDMGLDCGTLLLDVDSGMCVTCLGNNDCASFDVGSVCNTATHVCVECTASTDCHGDAGLAVCDTSTNHCVDCLMDDDCHSPAAPHCVDHMCGACANDSSCTHFADAGTPVCRADAGTCAACNPAHESVADAGECGANSCAADSWTCTATARGTSGLCAACKNDSECVTGDAGVYRCVPTTYDPGDGGVDAGTYCLVDRSSVPACPDGLPSTSSTPSLAGVVAEGGYCAPRESTTTCEAVGRSGGHCDGGVAGCGLGGVCNVNRCTYECAISVDCVDKGTTTFDCSDAGLCGY